MGVASKAREKGVQPDLTALNMLCSSCREHWQLALRVSTRLFRRLRPDTVTSCTLASAHGFPWSGVLLLLQFEDPAVTAACLSSFAKNIKWEVALTASAAFPGGWRRLSRAEVTSSLALIEGQSTSSQWHRSLELVHRLALLALRPTLPMLSAIASTSPVPSCLLGVEPCEHARQNQHVFQIGLATQCFACLHNTPNWQGLESLPR